ncbi:unnamed protein product [[Candida] boidinii]|nr:unnamed protein product [[Candida] boidinii]
MPLLTEDVSHDGQDSIESETSNFFSRVLSLMGNTRYAFGVFIDMEEGIIKFLEPLKFGYDSGIILRREIFQLMPDILVCNSKISIILDKKLSYAAETEEDTKIKSLLEVKGNKEFQSRDGEHFISSVIHKIQRDSHTDNVIYLELTSLRESSFYKEYVSILIKSAPGSGIVNTECLFTKFERVRFKDIMSINFDTFRALEIFENNSTGQKGCKSLFNLLNQTSCKIGREKLYSAILRPTTDIKILKNRFDTIDIILKEISIKRDENSMQSIISSCKSLPVITSTIKTFNNSLQKTSIWNQIRSYITNIINIFDSIDNSEELKESIYFRNYLDVFDKSLMNSLLEMINSTIDWNAESLNPQTISVLPGVDPQLAEYRATYNDMEIILDGTAKEISRRFDKMVADIITVAYIPQLGFLVALDSNEETEEFIDANITSSWFEVFSTGTTKYFKNETVEALDSKFGDVYSLICDAEIDILSILQDEIMKHSDILLKTNHSGGTHIKYI